MDPSWKRKMYYLPHLVGDKDNSANNCKIEKDVYCTPVLVLFCLFACTISSLLSFSKMHPPLL